MTHKKSERLGRVRVVSLAYDLIQHFSAHMSAERTPYGIVIAYAEMIARNYFAAVHGIEIL